MSSRGFNKYVIKTTLTSLWCSYYTFSTTTSTLLSASSLETSKSSIFCIWVTIVCQMTCPKHVLTYTHKWARGNRKEYQQVSSIFGDEWFLDLKLDKQISVCWGWDQSLFQQLISYDSMMTLAIAISFAISNG
jgi:hypothetical protein